MRSTPGHVLIVRLGALGDAVLTLPLVHALNRLGADRMTILGTPAAWDFLRPDAPGLRVFDAGSQAWTGLFDGSLGEPARKIAAQADSAILYLGEGASARAQASLQDAGIVNVILGSAPRRADRGRHVARWLLEPVAARWGEGVFGTLSAAPMTDDPLLRLDNGEADRALESLRIDPGFARSLIAIHPGSGGSAKCWPVERFLAIGRTATAVHGLVPIWITGPAEPPELIDAGHHGQFHARSLPLRKLLALLSRVRAFIGNDAGVTHLAARAVPTIALFGPTDPETWAPIGREVTIVRAPDGRMASLDVEPVAAALARICAGGRAQSR